MNIQTPLARLGVASHLAAIVLTLAAHADAQPASDAPPEPTTRTRSRFSLGLEGGTTGFGPVLSYTVSPKLNLSLSHGFLDRDFDLDDKKGRYDGSLKLSSLAAVANWHPMGGRFHLSAGAMVCDYALDITAKPKNGTTFEIGDHAYNHTQLASVTGKIKTDSSVAPYLGLGWTWHFGESGFSLTTNFGVMFATSYDAKLTATGPIVTDPTFIADLRKEEKTLADDLTVYPVAKIGFAYRF